MINNPTQPTMATSRRDGLLNISFFSEWPASYADLALEFDLKPEPVKEEIPFIDPALAERMLFIQSIVLGG